MGCRGEGARFGMPQLNNFVGEELLLLAQGDCVYLSTWVYLHGHHIHTILLGEVQAGVE